MQCDLSSTAQGDGKPNLDPYPWLDGANRIGREGGGCGFFDVRFAPRPEYSQNREDYPA